tara:strand:- start:36 stop:662 length:627 start_codon:yes stop_codon:yes gene_type:complete
MSNATKNEITVTAKKANVKIVDAYIEGSKKDTKTSHDAVKRMWNKTGYGQKVVSSIEKYKIEFNVTRLSKSHKEDGGYTKLSEDDMKLVNFLATDFGISTHKQAVINNPNCVSTQFSSQYMTCKRHVASQNLKMDGTPKTPTTDDGDDTGSAGDNSNGDRQELNKEPMTVDGIVAMFLNSTSATKASVIKEALIEINARLKSKTSDVG